MFLRLSFFVFFPVCFAVFLRAAIQTSTLNKSCSRFVDLCLSTFSPSLVEGWSRASFIWFYSLTQVVPPIGYGLRDRGLQNGGCCRSKMAVKTVNQALFCCCSQFLCSRCVVVSAVVLSISFRLRNDLYCVEWGVKLYSLTHSLCQSVTFSFLNWLSPKTWIGYCWSFWRISFGNELATRRQHVSNILSNCQTLSARKISKYLW